MSDCLIKGAKQLKKDILNEESIKQSKRKHKKPRLFDYIGKSMMIALFENSMDLIEVDNNVQADRIVQILGDSFQELGTGTNRIALVRDGYVFKIALDRRGIIDNLAEYKRSAEAPQYLAKCYETNRIVAISEYVNLMSYQEYIDNKSKIREILTRLSSEYVIKDLGLTPKNYCNWGYRDDGSIVALDYAYMYPIKGNENALRCSCGGHICLDSTFTFYKCDNSACGLKYSAMEILNKMNLDSERMDDEAVFREAGVNLEDAEIKFGDEFVNYVKLKSMDDNSNDVDEENTKVTSTPINTSSLASTIETYKELAQSLVMDDDDSPIDLNEDDEDYEITKEEFYSALKTFDSKED